MTQLPTASVSLDFFGPNAVLPSLWDWCPVTKPHRLTRKSRVFFFIFQQSLIFPIFPPSGPTAFFSAGFMVPPVLHHSIGRPLSHIADSRSPEGLETGTPPACGNPPFSPRATVARVLFLALRILTTSLSKGSYSYQRASDLFYSFSSPGLLSILFVSVEWTFLYN